MIKEHASLQQLLEHVLWWCDTLAKIVSIQGEAGFLKAEIVQLAMSKAIEGVGEYYGRIVRFHPQWAEQNPQIELADAYRFRNRLAHGYETTDLDMVWRVASTDIPRLAMACRDAIKVQNVP